MGGQIIGASAEIRGHRQIRLGRGAEIAPAIAPVHYRVRGHTSGGAGADPRSGDNGARNEAKDGNRERVKVLEETMTHQRHFIREGWYAQKELRRVVWMRADTLRPGRC